MPRRLPALLLFLALPAAAAEIPPIARVLPPVGLEIPADVRTRLEKRLAETKQRLEPFRGKELAPDVEIFTKAVELALLHREFYVEKDFAKADWALDQANQRLDSLAKGEAPWTKATGLVVRGYRSLIDSSAQPYGLVIPENHDFTKPTPLYVWLHGRGDKNTDLHFLQERATRKGQIAPPNAIVVHPFGRHCVGWKHAGEIDVLQATGVVKQQYKGDPDRIVLIGFSMGGAGAWHIGAHYTDLWVAVSPGAGFVDTRRYQNIAPDELPADYVQKLWGLYDVPDYVRNLFNTNVIAYSGELDAQRKAAVIMEEAFQGEGRQLTHLIGPGVAHAYEPETLKGLQRQIASLLGKGLDPYPKQLHLQTKTLQYSRMHWIRVHELEEHWKDARVDAEIVSGGRIRATTKNIRSLTLNPWEKMQGAVVDIDGQTVELVAEPTIRPETGLHSASLTRIDGRWRPTSDPQLDKRKNASRSGPIDDAFMGKFTVITPTGKSKNSTFQRWCEFELDHFRQRWRSLMRAELPEVRDLDFGKNENLTKASLDAGNLILFGDADSNSVIRQLLGHLPVQFENATWKLGDAAFDGDRYVPALIFPRPMSATGYVVLNSGLTFREGHDKTNSQQNPKLPDWAIIDITQPPDAFFPGRIHDADFFDEQWQLKRQPKAP